MNDLYSFDETTEDAARTYDKVNAAYEKIFNDHLELEFYKVRADSGIHGGRLSHEYHLRSPLNQDEIYYCHTCHGGGSTKVESPCSEHGSERISSVEIAHTFQLGTKYSSILNLKLNQKPLEMCCFGIGVTRLMHAVIEALSPTSGNALRLPKSIAPFDLAILVHGKLKDSPFVSSITSQFAQKYEHVLLDDRNETLGNRIRSLSLTGIPRYLVLGGNTVKTIQTKDPRMELHMALPLKEELLCLTEAGTLTEVMQRLDDYDH